MGQSATLLENLVDATELYSIGNRAACLGYAKPAFRLRQQYDTAIQRDLSAIEGSCDFLTRQGWKQGEKQGRIGHDGRTVYVLWKSWLQHLILYSRSETYTTAVSLETLDR